MCRRGSNSTGNPNRDASSKRKRKDQTYSKLHTNDERATTLRGKYRQQGYDIAKKYLTHISPLRATKIHAFIIRVAFKSSTKQNNIKSLQKLLYIHYNIVAGQLCYIFVKNARIFMRASIKVRIRQFFIPMPCFSCNFSKKSI